MVGNPSMKWYWQCNAEEKWAAICPRENKQVLRGEDYVPRFLPSQHHLFQKWCFPLSVLVSSNFVYFMPLSLSLVFHPGQNTAYLLRVNSRQTDCDQWLFLVVLSAPFWSSGENIIPYFVTTTLQKIMMVYWAPLEIKTQCVTPWSQYVFLYIYAIILCYVLDLWYAY